MANVLKQILRRTFFAKHGNLVALDNPYSAIAALLRGKSITGIIDAGASYGRVAQRLLRLFPNATLYAFEPNELYMDCWEKLAKEDPRLKPNYCALSNETGTAKLHVTSAAGSTSLHKPDDHFKKMFPEQTSILQEKEIPVITIDEWAQQNGNPSIQLMKFDIQGGESNALRGAMKMLKTSTLLVYVEVLFNSLYEGGAVFSDVDARLREVEYVLYNIYKPKANESGQLLYANAVYINPKLLSI